MRTAIVAFGLAAALFFLQQAIAADPPHRPVGQSPRLTPIAPDDEKAIRQLVEAFVKSYNDHDAKAIGQLFTRDGMTSDEEDNVARGRDAIEQVFANVFKNHPKTQITNEIESIRQAGPAEAVETGVTTVIVAPGAPAQKGRYRVIHVKRNGTWQMASATELPEDTWNGGPAMKQLDGLAGDWVDESPDGLVLSSYRWSDNHRFLYGQFTVQIGGKPAMTGTERIAWDPLKKTIRSWIFDSEGGFGEGIWSRQGNVWTVKIAGVTRNGKTASGTRIITPLAKDRLTVQTVERVVDNEKMPDGEKILIVRRPPAPK
ncbi:MAG: SgcJ/EcaC family oxidoreductase [Thermoguttaceae bacterium]